MASLKHVCMWSEHGWVRVSAEEAAVLHPDGTVSVRSGLFMCELCGQYVSLTGGNVRQRYFKHSAQESDKNCPERTFGPSYTPSFSPGEHELPIRLLLCGGSGFRLEMGLIGVPIQGLDTRSSGSIGITAVSGERFIYSLERLKEGTMTYVPIGSDPSKEYFLTVPEELSACWPQRVTGISSKGTLFDGHTGKKLPTDADVQTGRKYILLTAERPEDGKLQRAGIAAAFVCQQRSGQRSWRVYELEAKELTEDAAKFFLGLHCRLTDSPLEMRPLWPIHIETPYLLRHDGNEMFFHLSGGWQTTAKVFPDTGADSVRCPSESRGQVIKVDCDSRRQLVSAGRANVLAYFYLWKEPLPVPYPAPELRVRDGKENGAESGIQSRLPAREMITVDSDVDGTICLLKEDLLLERMWLPAKKPVTVRNIRFGITVRIQQGSDVVWTSTYKRPGSRRNTEDGALYRKLLSFQGKAVPVSHSLGGLASKMEDYPLTRQWLVQVIRKGCAPARALNHLKGYMSRQQRPDRRGKSEGLHRDPAGGGPALDMSDPRRETSQGALQKEQQGF